jgi:hypothetical protein
MQQLYGCSRRNVCLAIHFHIQHASPASGTDPVLSSIPDTSVIIGYCGWRCRQDCPAFRLCPLPPHAVAVPAGPSSSHPSQLAKSAHHPAHIQTSICGIWPGLLDWVSPEPLGLSLTAVLPLLQLLHTPMTAQALPSQVTLTELPVLLPLTVLPACQGWWAVSPCQLLACVWSDALVAGSLAATRSCDPRQMMERWAVEVMGVSRILPRLSR